MSRLTTTRGHRHGGGPGPGARARSWLAAGAGSLAAHAAALILVVGLIRGEGPAAALEPPALAPPDWIDVVPPPEVTDAPVADSRPAPPPPEARLDDAPEGDSDHDPWRPQAPREGDARTRGAPAPDAGDQRGTDTRGAWRRDRSTLRARLSDGASTYQPSHRRTPGAARVSSPQAERREPVIGAGDQVRSAPDPHASAEPPRSDRELAAAGDAAGQAADEAPRAPEPMSTSARPELPRPAPIADAARGVGPLDAVRGSRRFDVEAPGRAADDRDQRAASDELHPAITDLSRAGARAAAETRRGQGPGEAPGAVASPSDGAAPARSGGAAPADVGPDGDERTRDRQYQRYLQEIQRRVSAVREFPRNLALRLEQGETVVHFVLETDGRISNGVKVLKSSGFDEFDAAATRAVQRAAPFPPLPPARWARPLAVSIRVAFENPVVR